MDNLVEKYSIIYDKEGLVEEMVSLIESISEKAKKASEAAGNPHDEKLLFLIGMIFFYGNARKCLRDFQRMSIDRGDKDWAEFIESQIQTVDADLTNPLG